MSTYPFPMVRLTLEHMQYEIVQAMQAHADEIQDAVEEQVRIAVENFDWRSDVGRIARGAINEAIEREVKLFFGPGGPGTRAIKDAVAAKLDKDGSWNV